MRRATVTSIMCVLLALLGCSQERQLTVTATAFNSTHGQTDAHPFETACGNRLRPGARIIAVSRDLKAQGLVCGTEVEISGVDGIWVVGDVTARRHKQLIDIYMGRDAKAALRWGVQEVEISWRADSRPTRQVKVAEATPKH